MATTTERLRTFWGTRQFDRERVVSLAARYWQVALVVALVALAAGLRLHGLGARAIHHDESIHIRFAYDITKGVKYIHDPVYHGPFQYYAVATMFKLFGDTDITARLAAALFGTALVATPFLLRKRFGLIGTIVAVGLIAVSPTLAYVSRFAREDIYALTFMMGMVVCVWRYLADRKSGWLIAIGPLMALSFTAKEVSYISVAILLVYLDYLATTQLVEQIQASRKLTFQDTVIAYAVILPTAWLIVALWPFIGGLRKRLDLKEIPSAGHLLVLFGTLVLPLYAAGLQKLPFIPDKGYHVESEHTLMHVSIIVLMLAGAYIGIIWNWRVWLAAAVLFYIPYVLLFTSFFTNMPGFWTGMWGSMDYWLSQQHERRGNQPDYYYFMTLPVYEFLPLIFGIGASFYYAYRGRLEQQLISAAAMLIVLALTLTTMHTAIIGGLIGAHHIQIGFIIIIGAVLLLSMDGFTKFLLFWTLSIFFALTWAGEKMPWLTVHAALPLALLGAKVMDNILSSIGRPSEPEAEDPERQATVMQRLMPIVYAGLFALGAAGLFQKFGPGSAVSLLAWLLALASAAVVFWTYRKYSSWRLTGQAAAVGLFATLLVFTVRATGFAAFYEGDPDGTPDEMLIYAQGSPKLDVIFSNIEQLGRTSGIGYDLKIIIDNNGNIWPWPWYMRHYRNVEYSNFDSSFSPPAGSVVLVGSSDQAKMQPFLDQYQQPVPYTHMWWFPEFYRGLKADKFIADTFKGRYIKTWRGYFIDRKVPGATSAPDMFAYFPKEAKLTLPPVPVTAGTADPLPPGSYTVIGVPGTQAGQFAQPADVTVDAQGNLYVVDTLNHRVQKIGSDGTAKTFGTQGPDNGQFANPRSADYAVDDGPWGIGIAPNGNIYVADTWGHRVQMFTPDLKFSNVWGAGDLFGPRDIAFDKDGNVFIVDTGNKRIAKYTADGVLIKAFGASGNGPSQFNEPSSIAVAPNGEIFVADYWNQRIQHFDAEFRFIDDTKIQSWGSQGIADRAYIAAADNDTLLATDPANKRVLVFKRATDAQNRWNQVAAWSVPSAIGTSRPVGITVGGDGQVYISDAAAGDIIKVPLSVLLTPQPGAATP